MRAGGIRRRCTCKGGDGQPLGARCPKLKNRNHGSRMVRQELHPEKDGTRRMLRRSAGYRNDEEAKADLDHVRALLRLAEDDDDRDRISAQLAALKSKDPLPDLEETKRRLRRGRDLGRQLTVETWLAQWMEQESHRPATTLSYESHIRLYLVPHIGDIALDRLQVRHLTAMFQAIEDGNEAIRANNADRRALELAVKETSRRSEKRAIREALAALPPYRRPVGPSSKARIRATLRAALNDAIGQQLIEFNPAAHVVVTARKPRPVVWTDERVREFEESGVRPSPVMVWTPEQAGRFLDHVHEDDLYAMWHLALFRGLRRGELCGLRPVDVDLDRGVIEVTVQLTEVDYEIEEGEPKSHSGSRTVALDAATVDAMRAYRHRQRERRLAIGPAWTESGRFFTSPFGSALRPSSVTERFGVLLTEAGVPPVRLHDTRHCAATLALAAGVDLKVVQELLGHSMLSTTADLYTSVLPEVARTAAEATAAVVPRGRVAVAGTFGHRSGTSTVSDGG